MKFSDEILEKIGEEIRTQDNLGTEHPIFILFDREKMPTDYHYSDEYIYIDIDDESYEIDGNVEALRKYIKDTLESEQIPADIDTIDEDALLELLEKYHKIDKVYVKTIDVFKQAFFTSKSAHNFMEAKRHHFKDPYIYCETLYQNYEMQAIRDALLAGAFNKKQKSKDDIAIEIFGKPFKDISMKDCEIVNTRYNAQEVNKDERISG